MVFGVHVLTAPAIREQPLSLPTSIPSIWNIIRPSTNISWLSPFVVLLVQVFLTGGFYGSLVRVNTRQAVSPTTFLHDAAHSFWRLFLWYLLWTGINLLLVGVVRVFPQMNVTLTVLVLLLRYLFLFADVALVSERNIPLAFQLAVGTMLSGLVTMLPYGVLLIFLDKTLTLFVHSRFLDWIGRIVYRVRNRRYVAPPHGGGSLRVLRRGSRASVIRRRWPPSPSNSPAEHQGSAGWCHTTGLLTMNPCPSTNDTSSGRQGSNVSTLSSTVTTIGTSLF